MPLVANSAGVNGVTLDVELGPQDRGQLYKLIDVFHERRAVTAQAHDKGRVKSRIVMGSYVSVPVELYRTPGMCAPTARIGARRGMICSAGRYGWWRTSCTATDGWWRRRGPR